MILTRQSTQSFLIPGQDSSGFTGYPAHTRWNVFPGWRSPGAWSVDYGWANGASVYQFLTDIAATEAIAIDIDGMGRSLAALQKHAQEDPSEVE